MVDDRENIYTLLIEIRDMAVEGRTERREMRDDIRRIEGRMDQQSAMLSATAQVTAAIPRLESATDEAFSRLRELEDDARSMREVLRLKDAHRAGAQAERDRLLRFIHQIPKVWRWVITVAVPVGAAALGYIVG